MSSAIAICCSSAYCFLSFCSESIFRMARLKSWFCFSAKTYWEAAIFDYSSCYTWANCFSFSAFSVIILNSAANLSDFYFSARTFSFLILASASSLAYFSADYTLAMLAAAIASFWAKAYASFAAFSAAIFAFTAYASFSTFSCIALFSDSIFSSSAFFAYCNAAMLSYS